MIVFLTIIFQVRGLQKKSGPDNMHFRDTVERKKCVHLRSSRIFLFCSLAGAANVFNFIFACMTSSRHSEGRILLNRKRTVVILYQLYFGHSQKCIFFREDNGLFLKFCM